MVVMVVLLVCEPGAQVGASGRGSFVLVAFSLRRGTFERCRR